MSYHTIRILWICYGPGLACTACSSYSIVVIVRLLLVMYNYVILVLVRYMDHVSCTARGLPRYLIAVQLATRGSPSEQSD